MATSYSSTAGWERVLQREIKSKEVRMIEGRELELINLEEQVWEGITRGDIIDYYTRIFPYLQPYLKDRAVGINVSFDAPTEDEVFIIGMEGHQPTWATIFYTEREHKKAGKDNTIEWLVLNDLPSVIYNISLGAIDLHPWNASTTSPKEPDYIIIDLDPTDGDFKKAVETSKAVKEFIDKHTLTSFIKTSGKTGLHIFLPCQGIASEDARAIGDKISKSIHEMLPELTTLTTRVKGRGDKVYVDPSQNDYADRMAATYCLRSYKQPNISTPVDWSEVNEKLNPADFNMKTIFSRLEERGDLWKHLLDEDIQQNNSKKLIKFL